MLNFKNLYIFKFAALLNQLQHPAYSDASDLHDALSQKPFTDCAPTQSESMGWVAPLGKKATALTHQSGAFILLTMARQERILPAAVVREAVDEHIEAIKEKDARKVGSKERKEITEAIEFELLPQAFTRTSKTDAYLDINNGLLVINTPSAAKAETFATLLRKTVGSLPVEPLKTEHAGANLTRWLSRYQLPDSFEFGDECTLKSTGDDAGEVTFRKHELGTDEVKSHLETNKHVSKMAMLWDKKISFVVGDDLVIKKLKFLDVIEEKLNEEDPQTHEERVDIEFTILTGEVSQMLTGLMKAMDVSDTDVGEMGDIEIDGDQYVSPSSDREGAVDRETVIITFKGFNPRREARGANAAKFEVTEPGHELETLWMSKQDIRDNLAQFSELPLCVEQLNMGLMSYSK